MRTLDDALGILLAEKARTATIESYLGVPRLTIRRETLDEAILALRWLRAHRPINVTLLIEVMRRGPSAPPGNQFGRCRMREVNMSHATDVFYDGIFPFAMGQQSRAPSDEGARAPRRHGANPGRS